MIHLRLSKKKNFRHSLANLYNYYDTQTHTYTHAHMYINNFPYDNKYPRTSTLIFTLSPLSSPLHLIKNNTSTFALHSFSSFFLETKTKLLGVLSDLHFIYIYPHTHTYTYVYRLNTKP